MKIPATPFSVVFGLFHVLLSVIAVPAQCVFDGSAPTASMHAWVPFGTP